jgi:hypothetical protein
MCMKQIQMYYVVSVNFLLSTYLTMNLYKFDFFCCSSSTLKKSKIQNKHFVHDEEVQNIKQTFCSWRAEILENQIDRDHFDF